LFGKLVETDFSSITLSNGVGSNQAQCPAGSQEGERSQKEVRDNVRVTSDVVRELVADHLPDGVSLRDLGECHLRDLTRPERVFQLLL